MVAIKVIFYRKAAKDAKLRKLCYEVLSVIAVKKNKQ